MAVPKKRVSKTRGSLRHTNWKKQMIPQALIALSMGKKQLQISSGESAGGPPLGDSSFAVSPTTPLGD